jgi:predicted small secreted protein
MKKSIIIIASAVIISGTLFTACNTLKKDVSNAEENVEKANIALTQAEDNYQQDIENFRQETNTQIDANEKTIEVLKSKVDGKSAATKSAYWQRISELENKNAALKIRMREYKADTKENWNAFKKEFNHDMNGILSAFKDIGVENEKK